MAVDPVADAVIAGRLTVPSPDGEGPEAVQPERLVPRIGIIDFVQFESGFGHGRIGFMDRAVPQHDPEVVTASDFAVEPFRTGIHPVFRFGERLSVDGHLRSFDHRDRLVLEIGNRVRERYGLRVRRPVGQEGVYHQVIVVVGLRTELDLFRA